MSDDNTGLGMISHRALVAVFMPTVCLRAPRVGREGVHAANGTVCDSNTFE